MGLLKDKLLGMTNDEVILFFKKINEFVEMEEKATEEEEKAICSDFKKLKEYMDMKEFFQELEDIFTSQINSFIKDMAEDEE